MDDVEVEKIVASGLFSSKEEILNCLQAKAMLHKTSLLTALLNKSDVKDVCDSVYPTLSQLRVISGAKRPMIIPQFDEEPT